MNPDLARNIVVAVILACFVWLGIHDALGGAWSTAVASWCLAVANYLLLV